MRSIQSLLRFRLSARQARAVREALLAYAMLAPSLTLIAMFGLWPVLFAVYVSLHKWRIRRGPFIGMRNYVDAIDALAFLLFWAVALGFAWVAVRAWRAGWRALKKEPLPMRLASGGVAVLWAAAAGLLIRYVVVALGPVLDIANKAMRMKRTPGLFRRLLIEALHEPAVWTAWQQLLSVAALALLATVALLAWARRERRALAESTASLAVGVLFAGLSLVVAFYTWSELQRFAALIAEKEGRDLVLQVAAMAAGVAALFASWKVWQMAVAAAGNRGFVVKSLAAVLLMIGGWLLLAEVPVAIRAGDRDVWRGLVITVYYSAGTVPFQLALGLFFAVLLFQNVKGKELFRVIYFMPYVTPAVASAAVFRLMFSPRAAGPVNAVLTRLGIPPQRWLMEPRGIFQLLAEAVGWHIPSWAAGPSLALVVIMLYSIWTYVGYDTVIYLAGLGNIPQELKEAAAIDGANSWQIFRHVILPLLSPTTYFLSLIAVIGTFKAFNHIYVMREPGAQGTVNTFSVVIFDEFFTKTRYGYASALAFVLFAVILSLTYLNNRIQGSRVFYQ
ncbi:MAG: sugar ABC transporter permease [Chloroflexi bacterium]|nr:sugar ABC transporter permease [Chloroflexota bacterium]